MLAKLLQELLCVNVLWKGVLCLLGGSVAALKISDLDMTKQNKIKKKTLDWIKNGLRCFKE